MEFFDFANCLRAAGTMANGTGAEGAPRTTAVHNNTAI